MATSSTSWDDAVEVDHPEFLTSLATPSAPGLTTALSPVEVVGAQAPLEGSGTPSGGVVGLIIHDFISVPWSGREWVLEPSQAAHVRSLYRTLRNCEVRRSTARMAIVETLRSSIGAELRDRAVRSAARDLPNP